MNETVSRCPKCGSDNIKKSADGGRTSLFCRKCKTLFTGWQQSLIESLEKRVKELEQTLDGVRQSVEHEYVHVNEWLCAEERVRELEGRLREIADNTEYLIARFGKHEDALQLSILSINKIAQAALKGSGGLKWQTDLTAALSLIRELEWIWIQTRQGISECLCPFCQERKNKGHAPGCKLAAILKEQPSQSNPSAD